MNLYCERLKSKVNACTTVITLQGIGSSLSLQIEIYRMLYWVLSFLCFWMHLLGVSGDGECSIWIKQQLRPHLCTYLCTVVIVCIM